MAKAITPITRCKPSGNDEMESQIRARNGAGAPVNVIGSRVREGSTQHFSKHPIHGDLLTFVQWMQTIDGKEKSASQAQQIAVDVSKFLHFAEPDMLDLTMAYNVGKANEYLDVLKKEKLRAAGILGKVACIKTFLTFLETATEDDGLALEQTMPGDTLAKISRMRVKLSAWHAHFSKLKTQVGINLSMWLLWLRCYISYD